MILHNKLLLLVVSTLITLMCDCTNTRTAERHTEIAKGFPQKTWTHYANPAQARYSAEKLTLVRQELASIDTSSLMVVVDGKVLFEYGDVSEISMIMSIRKSILAILFGKYVENGVIDLDRSLDDLGIDDIDGLTKLEKTATIRDLISAKSGVYHGASNTGDDPNKPARGSKIPGTYFVYNNWDFNVAGAIFEKLVGRDIYTVMKHDLADPIGMEDFFLDKQEKSGDLQISKYPAYHFFLSTRDMARIGLLMLQKGKWAGAQVVSKNWVEKITSVVTPSLEKNPASERKGNGYGYMWHVSDENAKLPHFKDSYFAHGLHGQFIAVLPELDMVIAHKTIRSKDDSRRRSVTAEQFWRVIRLLFEARE